jgi:DNA-binding transcriptional MerR regulator
MVYPFQGNTSSMYNKNAQYKYKTNKDIMDRINKVKQKLIAKTATIQEVANSSYVDIIYYIFTVSIMCFFLYVVLSDIYKTIKLHNKQNSDSKGTDYQKNKRNLMSDDNDFTIEGEVFKNNNELVQSNLSKHNDELEENLKELSDFKNRNKLDPKVYTSITSKNISAEYDNYEYKTQKQSSSFWDLLFKKPKYPSITNESSGSFFAFI